MATVIDPPKTLSQIIDEIEEIRERLLSLQRSLEKLEPANPPRTQNGPFGRRTRNSIRSQRDKLS